MSSLFKLSSLFFFLLPQEVFNKVLILRLDRTFTNKQENKN